MAAIDAEARALARLAHELRRSDPVLARRLSTGRLRPRTSTVVMLALTVSLLGTFAVGLALGSHVVIALAWTALTGLYAAWLLVAEDGY